MLNTYFEIIRSFLIIIEIFKEIYFTFGLIILFLFKKITDSYYHKKIKNFLKLIVFKIDKLCNTLILMMSKHGKIIRNEKKFFNSIKVIKNLFSINSNIIKTDIFPNTKELKKKRNFLFFDLYYKSDKFIKFSLSKLNINLLDFFLEYSRNTRLNIILPYSVFLKYFKSFKILKFSLKKNINRRLMRHEYTLLNNLEYTYHYKNSLVLSPGVYNNNYLYFNNFILYIFFLNILFKNFSYNANSTCILNVFFNKNFHKNKKEIIKTKKNILNYSFLYRKLIRKVKFITLINIFKEDFEKIISQVKSKSFDSKQTFKTKKRSKSTLNINNQNEKNALSQLYNPLKLPLGWDNKPIPYWLYKLHGLNETFICEICGNYKFHGRIAFERHFSEIRHINSLRSLGIQYSKVYYEITTISKALELSNYFRKEQKKCRKEFEDQKGYISKEFF